MQRTEEAALEFLTHDRVAVTGVSRKGPREHGSNVVYTRLRDRGYDVFAINPNADSVEGDACYHDLKSVPDGVDWVVIGTRADAAEATMRECAELGVTRVWLHQAPFGAGSVSTTATEYGRTHGITVIDGGCPCAQEGLGPCGCPAGPRRPITAAGGTVTARRGHDVARSGARPSRRVPGTHRPDRRRGSACAAAARLAGADP
jgi:predicted CoA-binding protein